MHQRIACSVVAYALHAVYVKLTPDASVMRFACVLHNAAVARCEAEQEIYDDEGEDEVTANSFDNYRCHNSTMQ
jgi:hypothetical protein